jgi:hypothetical protein
VVAKLAPRDALSLIVRGASVVDLQPQAVAWIHEQNDTEPLHNLRAELSKWHQRAARASAERDVAYRLDIRAERRIGELLGPPELPEVSGAKRGVTDGYASPPAERMAASRARALSEVPDETFEAVLAKPKPSRAKVLAAAAVAAQAVDRALLDRVEAGETIVVSQRTDQGLIASLQPTGRYVRIDRQSDWGNPFETPADGDRATVIRNYRKHFLPFKPSLLARLPELRGKALGCWCAPLPCHGDVLIEALG